MDIQKCLIVVQFMAQIKMLIVRYLLVFLPRLALLHFYQTINSASLYHKCEQLQNG